MRWKPLTALTLVLAISGFVAGKPAVASESGASEWAETDQTAVRLVSASETVGEDGDLVLGLQFRMQPGWKVYWRSPGDAGFPPQTDWLGSRNLASAEVTWPAPLRFSVLDLETLGYKDEVVLPIKARAVTPKQAVEVRSNVKYLTCNEICIPYEADLKLDLEPGAPKPGGLAHLIDRYRATVPGDGSGAGLKIVSAAAATADKMGQLRVRVRSDLPFADPDLFVEGARGLAFSKPQTTFSRDRKQAVMDVTVDGLDALSDDKGAGLDGRWFTLTAVDGGRGVERRLQAEVLSGGATLAAASSAASEVSLAVILGLALLGGLILNLMPCVLPVLSIKVLGVIGHGGGENRFVRLSFLSSAAGILASFLLLAAILAGLKSGGASVGWGIQFQHPWFLILMTFVVVLFACNLWGFFEIHLPHGVSDIGERATHVHGLGGHFLQGAFATLLATPCSAPFLGTAIGFAFSRGIADIFMIFSALAVGLALPYLVIAAFPVFATRLPRPGAWMVRLKFILGFALAATAVWLVTVLAGTIGTIGSGAVALLMAGVGLVLFAAHRRHSRVSRGAFAATVALAGIALFVPAFLPAAALPTATAEAEAPGADVWQPFDLVRIDDLVREGKTVLVDVTADWCITCQVNKSVVLARGQVRDLLDGGGVVAMQADWTRPDEAISRYLAGFGRYGIPFNAVYGPKAPQGIPLPEILSETAVLDAVTQAGGDIAVSARQD